MIVTAHPLYDMIARLRNGYLRKKYFIYQPANRLCLKVLKILYQEGYIKHYSIYNATIVKVWLKYHWDQPTIKTMAVFSTNKKPVFLSLSQLWKLNLSTTLLVLSTTKGVFSGKQSRKHRLGGQLLCIIE